LWLISKIVNQKSMDPKKVIPFAIAAFIVFMLFIALTNTTFLTIESGEKGVLFERFGEGIDKEQVYDDGFHIIAPWNKMIIYDVRLKENLEQMEGISKNGLTIKTELSYFYKPIDQKIGYLHEEIGQGYHDQIIKPAIRSATREVIGKYLPEELYSTKRQAIQEEIFTYAKDAIAAKHLVLDAVLIREVELPTTLKEAIELKLEQEQESLAYEFRLEKARQEAERQRIEAEGKAAANLIINASLTEKILQEKGIEATTKLAESPNAKTVIIGSAKNGLPIILGQ